MTAIIPVKDRKENSDLQEKGLQIEDFHPKVTKEEEGILAATEATQETETREVQEIPGETEPFPAEEMTEAAETTSPEEKKALTKAIRETGAKTEKEAIPAKGAKIATG